MPYELSFTAPVEVSDPNLYINDCCWGCDVIRDRLFPAVSGSTQYDHIQTTQEDWGWFIWFREGELRLAIDMMCDDIEHREFRIRITSRRKKGWFEETIVDTEELERVKQMVVDGLKDWAGPVSIEHVDDRSTTERHR